MHKRGALKHEGKAFLLAGYSVTEVAAMFNGSRESVLTYNKRFWKVPLQRKMSEEDDELAKKMILEGFTCKEIASVVGFSECTVKERNMERWHLPYSDIQIAKKQVERTCKTCGNKFFVRAKKLEHDACNYCCKKCSHIGATKPDRIISPIFRGYRWSYISKEVRKEIPFCQRCGSKTKRLTVHHIKPWRLNGTNDLNNLLVVCDSCHRFVEAGSRQMFDLLDVDSTVKLIQMIYEYRMEKIKWIYTKLNSQKLAN